VVVINDGDAPLRAGLLNIVVPSSVQIQPREAIPGSGIPYVPGKIHYAVNRTSTNSEIVPGQTIDVRWTVAERDFAPAQHHIYTVAVTSLQPGERVPVLAALSGDGLTEELTARIEVEPPTVP
jgi:hypothetical protein